jgi:hypothetical protein
MDSCARASTGRLTTRLPAPAHFFGILGYVFKQCVNIHAGAELKFLNIVANGFARELNFFAIIEKIQAIVQDFLCHYKCFFDCSYCHRHCDATGMMK